MTLRDDVLAALTHEGQGYKELRGRVGKRISFSNLAATLKQLEDRKLAIREKQERPHIRGKTVDLMKRPRVLWRLR
jgi:DNA-binding HxlR family transcriptional regulator